MAVAVVAAVEAGGGGHRWRQQRCTRLAVQACVLFGAALVREEVQGRAGQGCKRASPDPLTREPRLIQ